MCHKYVPAALRHDAVFKYIIPDRVLKSASNDFFDMTKALCSAKGVYMACYCSRSSNLICLPWGAR